MKKRSTSAALFVTGFVVTYLILCYGIPGLRIKLAAEPLAYFLASIRHMVFVKALISLVAAVLFSAIPMLGDEKK